VQQVSNSIDAEATQQHLHLQEHLQQQEDKQQFPIKVLNQQQQTLEAHILGIRLSELFSRGVLVRTKHNSYRALPLIYKNIY
jgi:hypothetical protein